MLWRWLEIVTLVSFAIVQPVFWIVGEAPVFLIAHDLSGASVLLFAIAILVAPAVLFIALDSFALLLPHGAKEMVRAALRGVLIALILVPVLIHALNTPPLVSVALLTAAAGVATWLWLRFRAVAALVRVLWFAPVMFLVWFIVFSGAKALAFTDDQPVASGGGADRGVSVVWVVFDQLPLSLMVDENGAIRSGWYPNFARLAEESTWFAGATSVASSTAEAVPAALTGVVPEPGDLPVASAAPNNIFALLGRSHRVYAWETFTQLCPDSVCRQQSDLRPSIVDDTWILAVRRLLGDRLSDRLVPPIDDGWSRFGDRVDITVENEATSLSEIQAMRTRGDDRGRIDEFIASLGSSTGPSIHYLHIEKPHEPLLFLPDGRLYPPCGCFDTDRDARWPETGMTLHRIQAYVLQTMYVDTVLGRILDALERSSERERSVLVVMSDHGVSIAPGTQNRVLTRDTVNDILPVPMFIRLPGQVMGGRDDRSVQITSILPTVLDFLGMDWESLDTDGVSLLDPKATPKPRVLGESLVWGPSDRADATQSPLVGLLDELLPDKDDPYVFGPGISFLGTSVTDHAYVTSSLVARLRTPHLLAAHVSETDVPGQVFGQIVGSDSEVRVVVAVDDVIVASGWTFLFDGWNFAVMIDPSVFNGGGPGRVRLFEITSSGLEEITIEDN